VIDIVFYVPLDTANFQAITCTGTDNSKQTQEITPNKQKAQNKQINSP